MKNYISFLSIFFFIILGAKISYTQNNESEIIRLSEELIIRKIEKDTYIVTHSFPWPANSLLCQLTPSEFILVDTPYENNATQLLIEWIRDKNKKMNLRVINTHFHRDNLGGNGYLLKQNIPVYGSDLTVKLLYEKLKDPDSDLINDILKQPRYSQYYEVFKKNLNNNYYFKFSLNNVYIIVKLTIN